MIAPPIASRATPRWTPDPAHVGESRLAGLIAAQGCASYDELYRRSIAEPAWFWDGVVRDLGLTWRRPYHQTLDLSRGLPWARWFVGGETNLVDNCLARHLAAGRGGQPAVIWEGEEGATRTLSYGELAVEVACAAAGLRALGLQRGDAVGVYQPLTPETVVAVLALPHLGAITVPIFSGYAPPAVAARLADCDARLLLTADGFTRRGRPVAMKRAADEALALAPTVARAVVLRRLGASGGHPSGTGERSAGRSPGGVVARGTGGPLACNGSAAPPWTAPRDVWWHELTAQAANEAPAVALDPEDPLLVLYTSGTTGRPKGTLHVHGGFPLKAAMDMAYCFDVRAGDRICWFTDLGWMMGPWLIYGGLLLGATIVLYDGAPDFPTPERLWQLAARHRLTHLGLSPTVVRALARHGAELPRRHDLAALRVLGSTGEVWDPASWEWYFANVGGERCPVINYSGGTEISGGILGCDLLHPQYPAAFSGPILGMAADVVDAAGQPAPRGTVGELVLRAPWPGMTRGFWRDRQRYLESYWSRWPDVWVHGDWARVDEDGSWQILGRSDDTLNVAGKRVGPAEVESALAAHPAVAESAAVGVPDALKGEVIACFVVLRPDHAPTAPLAAELRAAVVAALGKALAPAELRFVRELPKTRNAKVMRRVIRARALGLDPGDLSALESREAADAIPLLTAPTAPPAATR